LVRKKVPALAGAFFCLFAGFFQGGREKTACFCVVNRGEFVVDSWWFVVNCVVYLGG
jgi:hypothetical protein